MDFDLVDGRDDTAVREEVVDAVLIEVGNPMARTFLVTSRASMARQVTM